MSKYVILVVPIIFSTTAQLLIKVASQKPYSSFGWFCFIALSLVSYVLAFVFYSVAVRYFPISVASTVNTVSVMLLVIIFGVVLWSESLNVTQILGICLGFVSVALILYK